MEIKERNEIESWKINGGASKLVGSLRYICHSRPDILFTISN